VDRNDPAFDSPSKPIGSFMDAAEAALRREQDGWDVAEDANRGWRRVVASPRPLRIIELDAIKTLVDAGVIVIAGSRFFALGGGEQRGRFIRVAFSHANLDEIDEGVRRLAAACHSLGTGAAAGAAAI